MQKDQIPEKLYIEPTLDIWKRIEQAATEHADDVASIDGLEIPSLTDNPTVIRYSKIKRSRKRKSS